MARAKALKARIKQEYRRNSLVLMSGIEFRKDMWVNVPRGKEDVAKRDYAEILDFEEGTVNPAEERAEAMADVKTGAPGTRIGADVQQAVWEEELSAAHVDGAVQTNLDRGGVKETTSGRSTSGKVRNPKKVE